MYFFITKMTQMKLNFLGGKDIHIRESTLILKQSQQVFQDVWSTQMPEECVPFEPIKEQLKHFVPFACKRGHKFSF